jgi:S-formylglutathione hydrolase FrmB
MAKLVTGRIEHADELERTLAALADAGFDRREYGAFYVGPAGQHDTFPIGGDAYRDKATEESGGGAAKGAALGGAAGLAVGAVGAIALPVAGIAAALAGAGVGAYVGSLMGAMSQTRHAGRSESTPEHPVEPQGGLRIAINVERPGTEARAMDILRQSGAEDIVPAEGEWRDGQWKDYDPRVPADQTRASTR